MRLHYIRVPNIRNLRVTIHGKYTIFQVYLWKGMFLKAKAINVKHYNQVKTKLKKNTLVLNSVEHAQMSLMEQTRSCIDHIEVISMNGHIHVHQLSYLT